MMNCGEMVIRVPDVRSLRVKGSVSSRIKICLGSFQQSFRARSESTGRYVGFKEYREIGRKRAVKEFVCESILCMMRACTGSQ